MKIEQSSSKQRQRATATWKVASAAAAVEVAVAVAIIASIPKRVLALLPSASLVRVRLVAALFFAHFASANTELTEAATF